jgi:PAS domain S-box-containing protein
MERIAVHNRRDTSTSLLSERTWRVGSVLVGCGAVVLSVASFALHEVGLGQGLLGLGLLMFCLVVVLHGRFLYLAQRQYRQTNSVLQKTEREFQSLFENALDTILILDDRATCTDANPSALQLLGVSRQELIGQPIARLYRNQGEFHCSWERLLRDRCNQGQSELLRGDSTSIFVEFTAVASFLPGRHMMILRDITQRRTAEEAMGKSLALARSARQEADAQRQATLALTQDLRMNHVLDTLLDTLHQLVPYEAAQVMLLETDSKLFLAREALSGDTGQLLECPKTLGASEYPVLQKALAGTGGTLIPDTLDLNEWRPINEGAAVRSWLCVPLFSSNQVLGLLSLSHTSPGRFSREHLRIAGSLSIPAAVAIQNARLYERAEIYGTELERRLSDLHTAKQALEHSEESRKTSEERFQKLFRSTPIAFSVTTLEDGRFIDVNDAFQDRYGYARSELIGRTSTDIGLWEHPGERTRLVLELRHGARVRGAVTRFRSKSGEFKVSLYSVETIRLDGQICLLAVFDDLPQRDSKYYN